MIRMELACFCVLLFLAVMFFSAKHERTAQDHCFAMLLIVSMIHLVLDGITVYTVNHMDTVPLTLNNVLHRLFLSTMVLDAYYMYKYVLLLVEDEARLPQIILKISQPGLVADLLFMWFFPITYVTSPAGNYSYGTPVFALYFYVGSELILILFVLAKNWHRLNKKARLGIGVSQALQLLILIWAMLSPLSLISGLGITLVVLGFYLTLENPDIYLLQQIQEEKKKAESANAAKSTFLSQMSHEIRTPMNSIVGMTDILLQTKLSDEQRDYLENIKSSGHTLVLLINDILDLSKIEAGKMELVMNVFDFRQMLREIRVIILNRIDSKPIDLIYEIDERIPDKLYGDGLRLRQVIINLLNNAVKFTEIGRIRLTIRQEEVWEDSMSLFISVSDTGQGIRSKDLETLFDAFTQVNTKNNQGKEGSGLGLAIASQIVGLMGGTLSVKSKFGEGSEFYFTISQKIVTKDMEQEEEEADTIQSFTAPEARILIVDDNKMNLKVARGLLAPFKMQIDTAEDGRMAILMIQGKKYDLVFMDHMMPELDGIQTTKLLRNIPGEYYQKLPIIALSANAMKDARQQFEDAGMNSFVAKPIDMVQVTQALLKWLPEDLIEEHTEIENASRIKITNDALNHLKGINPREGIKHSGSEKLYISSLHDFYKLIDSKAEKVEEYLTNKMIKEYTIEVHALKSTSRTIGATELGEGFELLEHLGRQKNLTSILEQTPKVLASYRDFKEILRPLVESAEPEKKCVPNEKLLFYVQGIQEAAAAVDLDTIDDAMQKLDACILPDNCLAEFEKLEVAVADVAFDDIIKITGEIMKLL